MSKQQDLNPAAHPVRSQPSSRRASRAVSSESRVQTIRDPNKGKAPVDERELNSNRVRTPVSDRLGPRAGSQQQRSHTDLGPHQFVVDVRDLTPEQKAALVTQEYVEFLQQKRAAEQATTPPAKRQLVFDRLGPLPPTTGRKDGARTGDRTTAVENRSVRSPDVDPTIPAPSTGFFGNMRSAHNEAPRPVPSTAHAGNVANTQDGLEARLKEFMAALIPAIPTPQPEMSYLGPFTGKIMNEPLPKGYKVPHLPMYNGTTDPGNHIAAYCGCMMMQTPDDSMMCKTFPASLAGDASIWFFKLPPQSISSFTQLVDQFTARFQTSKQMTRTLSHLLAVRQSQGESLRDYLARFNLESSLVHDKSDKDVINALTSGLRAGPLLASLAKTPARTLGELMRRTEKYMGQEETLNQRMASEGQGQIAQQSYQIPSLYSPVPNSAQLQRAKVPVSLPVPPGRRRVLERLVYPTEEVKTDKDVGKKEQTYTPLNTSRTEVFYAIEKAGLSRPPRRMSDKSEGRRDTTKFCDFHMDHGHLTEDCRDLKKFIESLIAKGCLKEFISQEQKQRINPEVNEVQDQLTEGVIHVISGGQSESLQSVSRKRKKEAQSLAVENSVDQEHNDEPLVLELKVNNFRMQRMLIDTGSSADIIF